MNVAIGWYLAVLKKYAVFEGRAARPEYWWFILVGIVVSIILRIIDGFFGAHQMGILGAIYAIGVLVPSLAVAVRRLHDTDRSGWWLLICFVPLIGFIVLIVFLALRGTPGPNRFGAAPAPLVLANAV
jgi:uncharacterized membrane protein YhaH (DUF805 family)